MQTLFFLVSALGCLATPGTTMGSNPDIPTTDTTETGSDSVKIEDKDDTGTAVDVCPTATHRCLDTVPAGWSGPYALWVGGAKDTSPGCGSGYPTLFDTFNQTLRAPDATCDCTCTDPVGVTCDDVVADAYANNACSGTPVASQVGGSHAPNLCNVVGQTPFTTWHLSVSKSVVLTAGSCTGTLTEEIPEATWDEQSRVCSTEDIRPGCDPGQICAPRTPPSFGKLCIAQVGDVTCPSEAYSERIVQYGDIDDDRECSECTCDPPTNACGGDLEARSGGCASGTTLIEAIPVGTCSMRSLNGISNLWLRFVPSTPACGLGNATPTGTADPAEPVTLCCVP